MLFVCGAILEMTSQRRCCTTFRSCILADLVGMIKGSAAISAENVNGPLLFVNTFVILLPQIRTYEERSKFCGVWAVLTVSWPREMTFQRCCTSYEPSRTSRTSTLFPQRASRMGSWLARLVARARRKLLRSLVTSGRTSMLGSFGSLPTLILEHFNPVKSAIRNYSWFQKTCHPRPN